MHDQGMDKPHLHEATTPMDFHHTPMDAVMHVETSAKTSAKSVLIAFQVRTAFSRPVGCQPIPFSCSHLSILSQCFSRDSI